VCTAVCYHVRALLSVTSESTSPKTSLNLEPHHYGTPCNNIEKLQRDHNALAGVVTERSKYHNTTPLLSEIHWLSIEAHIRHKVAVLTFRRFQQWSRSIWLNWSQLIHPHGNFDAVHVGPVNYMLFSETISYTVLSLVKFKSRLKTYLFNHFAVVHVTDHVLRFDIIAMMTWCVMNCAFSLLLLQ